MKEITHNDKTYKPSDHVDWDTAIDVGGFYFSRAQHLGLPEPPAACVFDMSGDEALSLIGQYHSAFKDAESQVACRRSDEATFV